MCHLLGNYDENSSDLWKRLGEGEIVKLFRLFAVSLSLTFLLTGVNLPENTAEAAKKPDIMFIYIDDMSPKATRLWSSCRRTPALCKFVKQGIWLKNAGASTPRCCPARVNAYTGRWSHNNGVTENDAGPFRPRQSVAVKLQKRGYYTVHHGKFLNNFPHYTPTRKSVFKYAKGWNVFDINWSHHGKFYNYSLWTKSGVEKHGNKPRDHSSLVAARKVAKHIRNAPKNKPLFAFVALYDGHAPYQPMARFERHEKCQDIKPWTGPSFNEEDVSDKPKYIRDLPIRSISSYNLRTRCEAILTVDFVTQKIRKALKQTGRLKNTLLIFTADNGWLMNEHRAVGKLLPYSTPVPLYMLWPRKWGNTKRIIREPVSNVDLAPTFCAIAGCKMGRADGINLLPLLNGRVDRLNRLFIYEENLHPGGNTRPSWYGIRTTHKYSDVLWAYTEYANGEEELYNLSEDPHELENLANRPAFAAKVKELHDMLHQQVIKPDGVKFRSS